ncbi:MAG: polysaccharide deacetylase family protein [Clostridia bacterium]|nr:polysaccharide deacetylase family protein [Clostridia bacterium]
MSDNNSKAPDFLQIKGYKYRAKMLIAGAAILLVILIILISIINGISSAIHKAKSDNSDTDTQSTSSVTSVAHISSNPYENSDTDSQDTESDTASKRIEEKFDADNKLIIDTDTLDGKKAVALTFDDGPGEYTQRLIEGLNERNAKGTFFMVGNNVDKYPEVLPLMISGGHQLGNHSFSHADLSTLSEAEIKDQISKADDSIRNACGQISNALRPPYGSHNTTVDNTVDKPIILWSLDTLDWKSRNEDDVYNEIISKCWDGDIILLHDIYSTSVDGVLMAIDELQEQGYVFVTVNDLLTRYGYDIALGTAHTSQYAVFETNSPYAAQYKEEMEDAKRRKAASEASEEAANAFYTASSDSDNNTVSSESYDNTYTESSQPSYDETSSYDSFYDDPYWDEE